MNELDTNEEIKTLITNIIIPENIGFHKLNYTMSRGMLKLLN